MLPDPQLQIVDRLVRSVYSFSDGYPDDGGDNQRRRPRLAKQGGRRGSPVGDLFRLPCLPQSLRLGLTGLGQRVLLVHCVVLAEKRGLKIAKGDFRRLA